MKIKYQDHALFLSDASLHWLDGELVDVGGAFVVQKPDGRILSVEPPGNFSDRDPGTKGEWERCQRDPTINVLRFAPGGIAYAVVYRAA